MERFDVKVLNLQWPPQDVEFVEVNVLDLGALRREISGADSVIHLAAIDTLGCIAARMTCALSSLLCRRHRVGCTTNGRCPPGRAWLVTSRIRRSGDRLPSFKAIHPGDREGIDTASRRAASEPGKFRMHNVCEPSQTLLGSKSQSC
jgi:hypothetical protein